MDIPQDKQELFNLCDLRRLLDEDTPTALVPPKGIYDKYRTTTSYALLVHGDACASHSKYAPTARSQVDRRKKEEACWQLVAGRSNVENVFEGVP